MEKDLPLGSVGDVDLQASKDSESAAGSVKLGPFEVELKAKLSNRALLELAASRVPGGLAHDAIVALEAALFPPAAPSS